MIKHYRNERASMRNINEWLEAYGESHKNPTNILIHKFCVPMITFSLLGLLFLIPLGSSLPQYLNVSTLACAIILLFYLYLSRSLFFGMLIQASLMIWAIIVLESRIPSLSFQLYLSTFILAWIMQFVGHKIEGKKPSFFEDIVFLLIGPLWTLRFLYEKLRIKV